MPLMTGTVFLAGALLSCLLPISLLIAFATFFTRQARQLPPNATPNGTPSTSTPVSAAAPAEPQATPTRPYSDA